VKAMKDGAEGGLVRVMNDLASAAKLGFCIDLEDVPIPEEVLALSKKFGFDPLSASSSGLLIAVVKKDAEDEVVNLLSSLGLNPTIIGKMLDQDEGRYMRQKGKLVPFPLSAEDPYSKLIS
ncbi:MAG: hypothetical protein DRO00_08770, partial [Thermoproteota archaeon]